MEYINKIYGKAKRGVIRNAPKALSLAKRTIKKSYNAHRSDVIRQRKIVAKRIKKGGSYFASENDYDLFKV